MSPTCPRPWCDLPADLLGHVTARLPFPADRARFRAVCRAWHSAAREHDARRRGLPWIVLPDASFCTIGDDGVFFDRIPGLPPAAAENVTCLGGAAAPTGGGWLALDCTDSEHRRTSLLEKILTNTLLPRCDVKHRHTYLLHNPFTNATVPLPELDSAFGHVTDEFEIRKVLMMRSGDGDDDGDVVVAVTTNSYKYSVVVCRPGKGMCVVPNLHILDVAFLGDTLYAVTVDEDVIVFDLTEDGNGRPTVAQYKRVIRRSLADGEKDLGSWMDQDDDDDDGGDDDDDSEDQEAAASDDEMEADGGYEDSNEDGGDEGGDELSSNSMEEEEDESNVDELSSNGEEEEEDEDQESDDEAAPHDPTEEEDVFNSYGKVARTVEYADENKEAAAVADDDEPKDYTTTARYLVASSDDKELLMVRHHQQTPPSSGAYTLKVEVFRADLSLREWVPIVTGDGGGGGGLAGEALFLSRSFSKSTPAYGGGVEEGLVYVAAPVDDVFDTRCWVPRTFTMPWQRKLAAAELLTWLFPPELVV